MSKKLFIVFSLAEKFPPQLFKSKNTVTKYIKKNANLEYRQFESQQQAEQFITKLERRSDTPMSKLNESDPKNILKKSNQEQDYAKHFTIETWSQRKERLQQLNKLKREHLHLNHSASDVAKIKTNKVIQKSKSKRGHKQESSTKMLSQQLFYSNLLAHQQEYGSAVDDVIIRLHDYLNSARIQSERQFNRNEEQTISVNTKKQSVTHQKDRIQQDFKKNSINIDQHNLSHSISQPKKDSKSKISNQHSKKQNKERIQLENKQTDSLIGINIETAKNDKDMLTVPRVQSIEKQQGSLEKQQTQNSESKQNFYAKQAEPCVSKIQEIKVQKYVQKKKVRFESQQHEQMYSLIRATVPFYQINTLSSQDIAKVNQSQQIQVETRVFRRQNPGYALAQYSIKNILKNDQIASRNFPIGVKKEEEDQIYGLACALNDLYFSGVKKGIQVRMKSTFGQQVNLQRYSNSIDPRIRTAASVLLKIKDKFTTNIFTHKVSQLL